MGNEELLVKGIEVEADVQSLIDRSPRPALHPGADEPPLILIVEDSQTQALYVQLLLDERNFRTRLAFDGEQGVTLARQLRPDLIILDMQMPELNGDEVLALLKNHPHLRHIPVIMVSAHDEIEAIARCIELGAEDYLPKPFNATLLYARVGASLEKKRLSDQERRYLHQIEAERSRYDELLNVILPREIVEELKATGVVRPRMYEGVAVLFADVVDFTPYCNTHSPEEAFVNLQLLAEAYESLTMKYGLQKIKTSGDAFLATAGLLEPLSNPVLSAVQCAMDMLPAARELPAAWEVRIGIHVGPVMAGVVGRHQYLFDIWGNTVNTAQRIESHGQAGAVNLSRDAWECARDLCHLKSLGTRDVKGKGDLEIYQVLGICKDEEQDVEVRS